jgi:hypothetical protein
MTVANNARRQVILLRRWRRGAMMDQTNEKNMFACYTCGVVHRAGRHNQKDTTKQIFSCFERIRQPVRRGVTRIFASMSAIFKTGHSSLQAASQHRPIADLSGTSVLRAHDVV